ncbi:probable pectinesterase/pectinesterase inhibitor 47 [Ziziphus jujuba]|uniref:Pectinesterase n=2 Tax=Ziziphus jujuba TaxID=326968 RepID=A0A6P3ZEH2_ZIZJJ|nr:probable pectinesterase/pectinesterase inhibitor 47 [Ziziphus jujuba]KAH7536800.1 hypothetical protein FEM48_Zijuj03G0024900 [Ziziphus jujuba var. spinosa]
MKKLHSSIFLFLSLLLFFLLPSLISSLSTSSSSPCKSSLYPKLCRSIISSIGTSPSDPYNYGKFSVKECLKQARKTSRVIRRYIHKLRRDLTFAEANAMEDCYQFSELNVEYFESISEELKSAESMNDELVDRVQTMLSAIVTNQQTCYDGLVAAGNGVVLGGGDLSVPLANATQLYSVSLGLVTSELARNLKKHRKRNGSSGRSGFSSKAHPIREHLTTLIKAVRKGSCHKSSRGCFLREERILGEGENSGGILVSDMVSVSPYGAESGDNFTSIGEAIASAPNNSRPEDGYFVIYAKQAYYEEYIVVPKYKKNIMLLGDGINLTVITGNHSVMDGWTTFNSSTFAVSGEGFIAIDVTFRNTAGPEKHQAVAVRNNADLSTFYRCSFEGYQDTLYVHSLRQFYRECDIYGTVDFIFGNAAAVFQNCNIYARKPMANQKNAVTAQGRTDPNQNTGISIHNCTIEAAPDLAMELNSTLNYLGRPWKVYSRTVFMQSYIGDLITPDGWLEWNGTVGLDTLYYGEFENYGPGSNTSMRVKWGGYNLMNVTQALNFTLYNFTLAETWLPQTDIPYHPGLIHVN